MNPLEEGARERAMALLDHIADSPDMLGGMPFWQQGVVLAGLRNLRGGLEDVSDETIAGFARNLSEMALGVAYGSAAT